MKFFILCLTIVCVSANMWDNLWSNNAQERVVFPKQFELKLSWNHTQSTSRVNNTNYVQGHIKVDQMTNRMMVTTNFSTLSLAPQELASYMLDFANKQVYLKQKERCIYYDIVLTDIVPEGINSDAMKKLEKKLPNISELFELFPYLMKRN